MKKLLALVLALVMTLGLATVSSSAAYSDQDDINYDEAVAVMSAIGIFEGKSGAFDPTANLNRAEAAKVVAYLMVGNKTAENLKGTGTKFTDVPASHWASGYIEYLASVGVVSGVGDNKFDPNGQVTAIQLAKMLLVALGYDAKIEGMVGPDWSINIQKLANTVGIFDGNKDIVGTAAVSRDEAALYAFNTIKSPLVEYDNNVTVDLNGQGTVNVGRNKAEYVINGKASEQTISYEVKTVNGTTNTITEFAEKYYPDLVLESRGSYVNYAGNRVYTDYQLDDFGRPSREWTFNKDKIGEYVANEYRVGEFTAKVTPKKVYDVIGKSAYDSLKDGESRLYATLDGAARVLASVDSTTIAAGVPVNVDSYANRNDADTTVNASGKGALTEVFMNDDKDIFISTINTYAFKAAADYNASKESIQIKETGDTSDLGLTLDSRTIELEDVENITELKKDDYLLVTMYLNSNNKYVVNSIDKAETLTGTVDGYKVNNNVTLNGEVKEYSSKTLEGADNVRGTEYSVGQEAIVVLDKYGYVIAVDEAVVANNYVFVAAITGTSDLNSNVVADAYFTDGSNKEISINKMWVYNNATPRVLTEVTKSNMATAAATKIDGTGNDGIGAVKAVGSTAGVANTTHSLYAGWYTYSVNSDGRYTLTEPSKSQFAFALRDAADVLVSEKVSFIIASKNSLTGNGALSNGTGTQLAMSRMVANKSNSIFADDKTIMVTEKDGTINVYTGVNNLPKVHADGTNYVFVDAVVNSDNYAKYVFVTLDKTGVTLTDSSNDKLIYVMKKDGDFKGKDQKSYGKWSVLDLENEKSVLVEGAEGETAFGANAAVPNTQVALTGIYKAFYRASMNSNDEYTTATAINPGTVSGSYKSDSNGKYFAIQTDTPVNNTNSTDVFYSEGTLKIGGQRFTLAKDAVITLISLKTPTSAINTGRPDAEVTYNISASTLETNLRNYTLCYRLDGRVDDDYSAGNRLLHELYVTVQDDGAHATTLTAPTADAINTALANYTSVTVSGTYTLNGNVTVPVGKTLTFNNLTNNATITNYGTLTVTGTLTDNGHIDNYKAMNVNGNVTINGTSLVAYNGSTTTLKGDVTVNKKLDLQNGATMTIGNTSAPKTLTFAAGSDVDLAGKLVAGDDGSSGKNQNVKLVIADGADWSFAVTADVKVTGNAEINEAASSAASGTKITVTGTTKTEDPAAKAALESYVAKNDSTPATVNVDTSKASEYTVTLKANIPVTVTAYVDGVQQSPVDMILGSTSTVTVPTHKVLQLKLSSPNVANELKGAFDKDGKILAAIDEDIYSIDSVTENQTVTLGKKAMALTLKGFDALGFAAKTGTNDIDKVDANATAYTGINGLNKVVYVPQKATVIATSKATTDDVPYAFTATTSAGTMNASYSGISVIDHIANNTAKYVDDTGAQKAEVEVAFTGDETSATLALTATPYKWIVTNYDNDTVGEKVSSSTGEYKVTYEAGTDAVKADDGKFYVKAETGTILMKVQATKAPTKWEAFKVTAQTGSAISGNDEQVFGAKETKTFTLGTFTAAVSTEPGTAVTGYGAKVTVAKSGSVIDTIGITTENESNTKKIGSDWYVKDADTELKLDVKATKTGWDKDTKNDLKLTVSPTGATIKKQGGSYATSATVISNATSDSAATTPTNAWVKTGTLTGTTPITVDYSVAGEWFAEGGV